MAAAPDVGTPAQRVRMMPQGMSGVEPPVEVPVEGVIGFQSPVKATPEPVIDAESRVEPTPETVSCPATRLVLAPELVTATAAHLTTKACQTILHVPSNAPPSTAKAAVQFSRLGCFHTIHPDAE